MRSAAGASMRSPVNAICIACAEGTAFNRRCKPDTAGIDPTVASGKPKLALLDAMRRSHCSATSRPAPRQWPLTAAISGFHTARSLRSISRM